MHFPVCVIRTDGELDFQNDVFQKIIAPEGGHTTLDTSHHFFPEYRKKIAIAYQRAFDGHESKCFAAVKTHDGNSASFEMYLFPINGTTDSVDVLVFFIPVESRVASFDDQVSNSNGETVDNSNIYEFSPFPIIRVEKDLSIISISSSVEEFTGVSRDEIKREESRLYNLFLPFDLERIKRCVSEIVAGTATFKRVNDVKLVTPQGDNRWANIVIYPILRDKKRILAEIIIEDITRIKSLENKVSSLNRIQIIGDLTMGLLHSFSNFSNIVINRAQMLLQLTEKQAVADGLTTIQKAAVDASRHIKRIQDFISDDKSDEQSAPEEIIDIIEDTIEFARIHFKVEQHDKKKITSISRQYFSRGKIKVHAKTLREVFISLLFRAASFTGIRGEIEVELRRDTDFIFSVSCTIPESKNDEIEPEPPSAIEIRRIAEKTNVRIFEEISPEKYIVRAVIPNSMISEETQKTVPPAPAKIRDINILIVEDEIALQELLFELFDQMGNRVSVCSNGDDALAEFRANRYDLVISDYGLAGISGIELLKKIRELDEKTATVLLSGWPFEDTAKYEKTLDLFIAKPFHLDELIRGISKVISSKMVK